MNLMYKSLIFFTLGLSVIVHGVQALDFSCVAMEEGAIQEELYYRNGDEGFFPIKLRSKRRSVSYRASVVDGAFGVYMKGPITVDGVQTYPLVGEARVNPSASRILLLLTKRVEKDLPLGVYPVDDSIELFPAGSFRFFNVTPKLMAIKFGEEEFVIASGEAITIRTGRTSQGFQPVHMIDQNADTLFKSSWYVNPEVRELVIIHPVENSRTKQVGLKVVSGVIPVSR